MQVDYSDPFAAQQAQAQASLQAAQQAKQYRMPQGPGMVGRVYVGAHPLQGLAEVLRTRQAANQEEEAMKQLQGIGQQRQAEQGRVSQAMIDAVRGTPAVAPQKTEAAIPAFDEADAQAQQANVGGYSGMTGGQAAKAGSMMDAYKVAQQSTLPEYRKFGTEGMMKSAQDQISRQQDQQIWAASGGDARKALQLGMDANKVKIYSELGGDMAKDLLVRDPVTGQMVPNTALINVKQQIAKSGAANVNVNTANKPMLTELGKGVGEGITNAWTGAQSAAGTLQNVAQMRQGLNNAFVGPAANQRVSLAQIGEVLGVNGATTTEKLENTRNIMQGLARQELSAAGQMKGQGQITESERGILRKAESGQINELTQPELNVLLGALEKTANARISQHNQNLQRLKRDPAAAGVADYMNVDVPSVVKKQNAPNSGGAGRIRFDEQGNIIP